jgi:hypothetical protein
MVCTPKNFYELEERIPSETFINLIESMPEACIKNNGWPTKYKLLSIKYNLYWLTGW